MTLTKADYKTYITSNEWRSKHKDFLKASHYRCAFFPWVKIGKKHCYNVHHMNYKNLVDFGGSSATIYRANIT